MAHVLGSYIITFIVQTIFISFQQANSLIALACSSCIFIAGQCLNSVIVNDWCYSARPIIVLPSLSNAYHFHQYSNIPIHG